MRFAAVLEVGRPYLHLCLDTDGWACYNRYKVKEDGEHV
jgi:hypothetical protein